MCRDGTRPGERPDPSLDSLNAPFSQRFRSPHRGDAATGATAASTELVVQVVETRPQALSETSLSASAANRAKDRRWVSDLPSIPGPRGAVTAR